MVHHKVRKGAGGSGSETDRYGPLVKRLRQRPLTPLTWVRFPHGSPIVGVDDNEGPPVPIPNTEVKLVDVDNTWLETARDDRKTPTSMKHRRDFCGVFVLSSKITECFSNTRPKSTPFLICIMIQVPFPAPPGKTAGRTPCAALPAVLSKASRCRHGLPPAA